MALITSGLFLLRQNFVAGFTYNRGSKRFFDTRMDRPLSQIVETGRFIGHGAPCEHAHAKTVTPQGKAV